MFGLHGDAAAKAAGSNDTTFALVMLLLRCEEREEPIIRIASSNSVGASWVSGALLQLLTGVLRFVQGLRSSYERDLQLKAGKISA